MSKGCVIVPLDDGVGLRCYDLEQAYGELVIQLKAEELAEDLL